MLKKDYKAYIFDLDGTLLDTLDDLTNSVNAALKQNDMPVRSRDEVRSFVGNGIEKLMERSVPNGKENVLFGEAFEAFKKDYAEHCSDNTKAYDGIDEMLSKLKAHGKKLAIVSNKADFAVKELCKGYFGGVIETSIGEKSGVRKKPAPDTVFKAMEELGVQPSDCVYIGDSDVDVNTAKNSGLECISVTWGFRDRDFLQLHGAKYYADKPNDVCQLTGISD